MSPSGGLLKRYGLSLEQYEAMAAYSAGCHLCGKPWKPGKTRYVDHDHRTGAVRGLLDFTCNHRLLGRGLDKVALHAAAALYLAKERDWRKA